MPKIPRDISGRKLAGLLKKLGYEITRENLNNILKEIAARQNIEKKELVRRLFY